MPAWRYTAASSEGGIRQGVVEALTKAQAVKSLQERGLMLMDICEDRSFRPPPPPPPTPSLPPPAPQSSLGAPSSLGAVRWSRLERAVFLRQLALMFNSGISLFRAFEVLRSQARRPALRRSLEAALTALEGGVTLSLVCERTGLFTPLQVGTVRVGEATGQLGHLLESLAGLEEQEVNFQRQLLARLSYPAGVLLAVVVGLALLGHVMGGALTGLAASLPGSSSTWWLLTLGQGLASPWFLAAALGLPLAGATGLRWLWAQEGARTSLEGALLGLPTLGPLWRRMQSAQLCRLLAVMIASGVRADRTLELARLTTPSPAAQAALKVCQDTLREGAGLAQALQRPRFFPPEVIHMAAAGEESGRSAAMLEKVAHYCEVEVERFLETACAALEPLAMATLGVGVGVVILVTFAPIYQVLDRL